MENIFTLLYLITSISTINSSNIDVDSFLDRVLASRKFSKVVDLIAEKTILKLWNMNNTVTNISNYQYDKVDEKIRRNVNDFDEKSLRNLSLKYTDLNKLKNFHNLVYKATILNESNSESNEIDKSREDTTKGVNSSTFFLQEDSLNSNPTEDIFDFNKQRDLNRKKSERKDGQKIFVFQSSSDYDEYHEKVERIIKNDQVLNDDS